MLQQRLGVLLLEAEEPQVFAAAYAGYENEVLLGVAEGIDGHSGEPLLDGVDRQGFVPAGSVFGERDPGPGAWQ